MSVTTKPFTGSRGSGLRIMAGRNIGPKLIARAYDTQFKTVNHSERNVKENEMRYEIALANNTRSFHLFNGFGLYIALEITYLQIAIETRATISR